MKHARRVAATAALCALVIAGPAPAQADGADTFRCLRAGATPVCQDAPDSTEVGTATFGDGGDCHTPSTDCPAPPGIVAADGCQYKLTDPSATTVEAMAAAADTTHGAWYIRECGDGPTRLQNLVFLTSPPVGDPQILAQHARAIVDLPSTRILTGGDTGMPIGLWLDPESWQPQTAVASADGAAVEITATPALAVWQFANGSAVLCGSAATPWMTVVVAARLGGADCGPIHASALSTNATRRVTVTVLWTLAVAGDASQVVLAPRTTTATTSLTNPAPTPGPAATPDRPSDPTAYQSDGDDDGFLDPVVRSPEHGVDCRSVDVDGRRPLL